MAGGASGSRHEETAKLLVDEGLFKHLPDLFDLRAERLLELEGFGEISANALVDGIERASHCDLVVVAGAA